jgi:hypothetical protein
LRFVFKTLAYKSGFVEFARSIREQIDQMVLSGQLNTGQGTQNEALKCIQIVSTGKNVSSSENDEGNKHLKYSIENRILCSCSRRKSTWYNGTKIPHAFFNI